MMIITMNVMNVMIVTNVTNGSCPQDGEPVSKTAGAMIDEANEQLANKLSGGNKVRRTII